MNAAFLFMIAAFIWLIWLSIVSGILPALYKGIIPALERIAKALEKIAKERE